MTSPATPRSSREPDRSPLTAKELRRRYLQGDRHFANVDLSGESLCGLNLQGIDLTGANLSHTDLRGTNFTDATLVGATLCGAKTGTQRLWGLLKLLVAWGGGGLSSFLSAAFWAYVALQLLHPNGANSLTNTPSGDITAGIVGIVVLIAFLLLICFRGIFATLGIAISAVTVSVAIAYVSAFAILGDFTFVVDFVFAFAVAGAGAVAAAFAISVTFSITFAFTFAVAGAFAIATSITIATFFAIAITVAINIADVQVIIIAAISTFALIALSYLTCLRALQGDHRDQLIRNIAVWLAGWGSTQFQGADLTDADCSKAILKTAHLYGTTLTRTRFHLAQQVNLARLGNTILSDFAVQDLLVTLRGRGKSYRGKNLQGANLVGADLADADFTEADLSQATLEGADLQRVNLTKTQALGTQFRQADLTGACLEAWNIDSTTQLDGAICEFVYLLNHQQERRPNSGNFQPGEFTKLFEEVLDTIDLIFQNGIDWKAFLQTFRQVQVQYGEADLAIQSIENKGDGVAVVKLHAASESDKAAIHQSFMQGYQMALQEAEERYRAQLHAKEEEIQYHRQQNTNMQEVVKLLAARPINVDVKAVAQSKAMQGNDQSQNFNVQGDFSINAENSVVNLRDISGQVTNQIRQIPAESAPDQPSLKDLLAQLQTAIETDTELSDEEKAEALAEVGELATAAQNPQEGTMQKMAKRAMNGLRGIASGLSDASKLASACKDLFPLIIPLFGLL